MLKRKALRSSTVKRYPGTGDGFHYSSLRQSYFPWHEIRPTRPTGQVLRNRPPVPGTPLPCARGSRMEGVRVLQDRRAIHDGTSNSEAKGPTQLHPQNEPRDRCPVSGHLSHRALGVDIPRWVGVLPDTLHGHIPSDSRRESVRTLQDGRAIHDRTSNSEAKGPAQLHLQNASRDRCPVSGHLSRRVLGRDIH